MGELKYNTNPDFAGLDVMKAKQAETCAAFQRWAAAGQWKEFHSHHYDWWMFPIPRPSQHGTRYTVYSGDIARLKQDAGYMASYRLGHELLARAWGWCLVSAEFIPPDITGPGQRWSDWPIRLSKAAHSAREFGEKEILRSHCIHAAHLIGRGEYFWFNDFDVAKWFRENAPEDVRIPAPA
ncbi:hypothetical protein DB346_18485 [Verrucomicrobia bacterium LW23]|nr:hypothetical protein DB346_18485 [Verrucomicrobia bacterium LW23]